MSNKLVIKFNVFVGLMILLGLFTTELGWAALLGVFAFQTNKRF
jgi:hypothetical protein